MHEGKPLKGLEDSYLKGEIKLLPGNAITRKKILKGEVISAEFLQNGVLVELGGRRREWC